MGSFSKLEAECTSAVTCHFKQKNEMSKKCKRNSVKNGKNSEQIFLGFLKRAVILTAIVAHIISFLLFSIFILYATETTRVHEPTDRFIFEVIHNLFTPLVRASRIVSLFLYLHKFPQSYDANMKNCFLLNPFFELETECQMCQDVDEVIDLSGLSSSTFHNKYHHNGIPFIVKDAFPTPFNVTEFKEFLFQNQFIDDFPMDKYSHKELEIIPTKKSNAVRKFFPVPDFIPPESDIHNQQNIFIDGPSSSAHNLPMSGFGNAFVIQAHGSRSYSLTPIWKCKPTCSSVSVVLEPGDVLYYSMYFWRFVLSQPISISNDTTTENVSIANLGSFYI